MQHLGEEGSGTAQLTLYINPRFLIPPSPLSLSLSPSLFKRAFSLHTSGAFLWMFPIPRPCNSFSSFFPSRYFSHPLWPYLSVLPFVPSSLLLIIWFWTFFPIIPFSPFPVLCCHSSFFSSSAFCLSNAPHIPFFPLFSLPPPSFFLFVLLGRAASLPGFSRPRCECWRRRNERRSCLWSLSLGHLLRQPAPERRPTPQSSFSHPLPTSYTPQPEWRDVRQPKSLYGKRDHNNIKHGKRIRRRGSRSLTALRQSEWRTITSLTSALFHHFFFSVRHIVIGRRSSLHHPHQTSKGLSSGWISYFLLTNVKNKKLQHDFSSYIPLEWQRAVVSSEPNMSDSREWSEFLNLVFVFVFLNNLLGNWPLECCVKQKDIKFSKNPTKWVKRSKPVQKTPAFKAFWSRYARIVMSSGFLSAFSASFNRVLNKQQNNNLNTTFPFRISLIHSNVTWTILWSGTGKHF